jgi:integrase/recombinase XerD
MSKDWYQQSINALQLNGKGERTQQAYTRALRMLVDFIGKRPAAISEQELEAYFLHRRNVDHWSSNTMRICYCGIRFFLRSTCSSAIGICSRSCAPRASHACPRC